jgi:hypothetical protein
MKWKLTTTRSNSVLVCVRFRIHRYVAVPSTNVTEEFEAVIVGVDHVETTVAAAHTVVERQPTQGAKTTVYLAFPTLYRGLFFT